MIKRLTNYVFDNSLLLIAGALAGLLWANLGPESYHWLHDVRLFSLPGLPLHAEESRQGVGLHYLVNDVLMALFFALAGKEVWEAMLPGGALRQVRRAAVPMVCAVGGMAAPAGLYVLGAAMIGGLAELGPGWAIPCATDIAFSYMVARLLFGQHHPAVPFLLLLAIADDALGLIILALFYPLRPVLPWWLLLPVLAVLLGLAMRRRGVQRFWWYLLIPGFISWTGFAFSGLHPALALLPIIPTLPHAGTGEARPHWYDSSHHDALHQFEAVWKRPVEIILGLFGLFNAGVAITATGAPTLLVLAGLMIGKPIGIFLSGLAAVKLFRLTWPDGLGWRELLVIGCAAGIGFTVALFVATVAFASGPLQDSAKMGALASGLSAATALLAARLLKIRPGKTAA